MRTPMRVAAVLLLVAAGVVADPEGLVKRLGSADLEDRARARERLIALGESAWPVLVPARDHEDKNVRDGVAHVLRCWGWQPPEVMAKLGGGPRLEALRCGDAVALDRIVRLGGVEALKKVYDTPVGNFEFELSGTKQSTWSVGSHTTIVRLRNRSPHPAWATRPTIRQVRWKPLGHYISVESSRRWFCAEPVRRDAPKTYWVRPGESFDTVMRIRFRRPGSAVLEVRVEGFHHKELRAKLRMNVEAVSRTFHVLPSAAMWGKLVEGIRVDVQKTLHVSLIGDSNVKTPPALAAAFFVALDEQGELVAHGPLDGRPVKSLAYDPRELDLASGMQGSFKPPKTVPKIATHFLVGVELFPGGSERVVAMSRRYPISEMLE